MLRLLLSISLMGVFLMSIFASGVYAQETSASGKWKHVAGDQGTDIMVEEAFTGRVFVVRCHRRETKAFILWNEFVGATPRVEYRIDEQAPKEQIWNSASNGMASFFPGRVIEFLKKLEGNNQLTAKVTPKGRHVTMATFDITGIETALTPIKKACRWK